MLLLVPDGSAPLSTSQTPGIFLPHGNHPPRFAQKRPKMRKYPVSGSYLEENLGVVRGQRSELVDRLEIMERQQEVKYNTHWFQPQSAKYHV